MEHLTQITFSDKELRILVLMSYVSACTVLGRPYAEDTSEYLIELRKNSKECAKLSLKLGGII